MPTPHISGNKGDFADVMLMPGDPLRAKLIADTFLKDVKQVTGVRNVLGFTGTFKGRRISVMAHGMGIPSASIYTTELIKDFGVKTIIRIGTCGSVDSKLLGLRDIVLAQGACTDSKVNRMRFLDHDWAAICDFGLLLSAVEVAAEQKIPVKVGNVFTSDLFYGVQPTLLDVLKSMKVCAVEMELAGIYGVAAQYGAKVLGILTCSDVIPTHEGLSALDRQTSFTQMMDIALEVAVREVDALAKSKKSKL